MERLLIVALTGEAGGSLRVPILLRRALAQRSREKPTLESQDACPPKRIPCGQFSLIPKVQV